VRPRAFKRFGLRFRQGLGVVGLCVERTQPSARLSPPMPVPPAEPAPPAAGNDSHPAGALMLLAASDPGLVWLEKRKKASTR